jgi:nitrate reductase alpha subunit
MTVKKAGHMKDIHSAEERRWEDFYRTRNQYDKVVRSTHGVNCTGSCSWNIYVKNGIVTNELQATDYPQIGSDLPNYEPRGCARGASFSWYLYSPLRVKYPYIRGRLLDLWNEALKQHDDPVSAWESIVSDKERRKSFQQARGKGGLRRTDWDTVLDIIAASSVYTIKKYGPDRITGFSPIPAMSQVSYAAGARFLQLIGGSCLSFYDWYCDLPAASPQVWGEQTDVCESADWYNSMYTVVMGSNISMTRTPDAHFLTESRYKGTKVVALSPDYSQVAKHSDLWIPVKKGQDAAFWLAVNHVILKEFYINKDTPYFREYVKKYTDLPFLVRLEETKDGFRAGKYLRCSDIAEFAGEENASWKMLLADENTDSLYAPKGTIGYRWAKEKGKWNLEDTDGIEGTERKPVLSFSGSGEQVDFCADNFCDPSGHAFVRRKIGVRKIKTLSGEIYAATVFDVLCAGSGVGVGEGYPADYDADDVYTPAWQEKYTGTDRKTVIQVAREFAENAEKTNGRSMIIIGAGVNQWYHSDLSYRSAITALMLTGSVGVNGGGLAHYVGQEKVAMLSSWSALAMATDWSKPPRLQNAPSFWYIHSDQFKYENSVFDYFSVPDESKFKERHSADFNAKAVRLGWLPFYPQFGESSIKAGEEALAEAGGDKTLAAKLIAAKLKSGKLDFAIEDPDNESNFPRLWFIWRGNAISSSAKGHEYFLKHVLGTDHSVHGEESGFEFENIKSRKSPEGKVDLIVDLNFRMDTSAVYSDIILPAATWYEKNDLNTSDMHTFVHPLTEAVPALWESASDWEIFRRISESFSRTASKHFVKPVHDLVATPLSHDTPDEIAQETAEDWKYGYTDPVPGKNMPKLTFVERDYSAIHTKYITLGKSVGENGIGAHGVSWKSAEEYEELKILNGVNVVGGENMVDISTDIQAAGAILRLAPEGNGQAAVKAFRDLEEKTGRPLVHLVEGYEKYSVSFDEITRQPKRIINSPCWSGKVDKGRTYAPFTLNVEDLVPWRTLTGRQQFYLDHEVYIHAGENLPVYKPELDRETLNETLGGEGGISLNLLTPHGKWNIHSTYFDNERMLTLSRGGQCVWMNPQDAQKADLTDNDWVEMSNRNGNVVCRVVVSVRIPEGMCIMYHAPERTIDVPLSPSTGKRGGVHNSLSRVRLKPTLMAGGYGQFTYYFNYWGPIGVNRETFVNVKKITAVRY